MRNTNEGLKTEFNDTSSFDLYTGLDDFTKYLVDVGYCMIENGQLLWTQNPNKPKCLPYSLLVEAYKNKGKS